MGTENKMELRRDNNFQVDFTISRLYTSTSVSNFHCFLIYRTNWSHTFKSFKMFQTLGEECYSTINLGFQICVCLWLVCGLCLCQGSFRYVFEHIDLICVCLFVCLFVFFSFMAFGLCFRDFDFGWVTFVKKSLNWGKTKIFKNLLV